MIALAAETFHWFPKFIFLTQKLKLVELLVSSFFSLDDPLLELLVLLLEFELELLLPPPPLPDGTGVDQQKVLRQE